MKSRYHISMPYVIVFFSLLFLPTVLFSQIVENLPIPVQPKKPVEVQDPMPRDIDVPTAGTIRREAVRDMRDEAAENHPPVRELTLKEPHAANPLVSVEVTPNVNLQFGYRRQDMNKDFYEFGSEGINREGYAGFNFKF